MSAESLLLPGSGPDGVVLVHGLGGAPSEMRYLAKFLQQRGYTVSVPLLAGHGNGEDHLLGSTWQDWLDSVAAAESVLRASVRNVHAAGVCIGGALAVALAAARPAIQSAAVYSMTFRYDGWSIPRWARLAPLLQHVAWMPGVRRLAFEESEPYGLKDERLRRLVAASPQRFIAGSIMRLPFGALRQMFRLGSHVEQVGGRVRAPTLILHAAEDDMSHPRNAWRLQRAIGDNAQVHLLDDCFHMIHVDQQRELVAQLTADFFSAGQSRG
jgi:carboxylesterase